MQLDGQQLERVLTHYAVLVAQRVRTGMQMTPRQYAHIAATVCDRAPCNLLVFGCGRDSPLWQEVNPGGNTVFVEDVAAWATDARRRNLQVVDVRYQSRLHNWMETPTPPHGLCEELLGTQWTVVMVDAPLGVGDSPGREQSIYTAGIIRERHRPSAVFVHDYARPWERACCDRYLGPATSVVEGDLGIWLPDGAG